jgi:hypothetical protein
MTTEAYELPEPVAWMFRQEAHDTHNGMCDTRFVRGPCDGKLPGYQATALYTADQVRAAIQQERERCAKVAEALRANADPDDPHKLTAMACAAAIRAG